MPHGAGVMETSSTARIRTALLLGIITAFCLLPALGARDHWSSAEGRGPLIAKDMLATGRIVPPYLGGRAYINKPPLFHGMIALSFAVFGESTASARLPALVGAALTACFVFLLTCDRFGRRAGVAASLLVVGTGVFFVQARSAELETLLAAFVTLTYLAVSRTFFGGYRHALGVLAAAGVLLATWTKGPVIALLFPLIYVAAMTWHTRDFQGATRIVAWMLGGALVATLAYWGPILQYPDTATELARRAMFGNVGHRRGPLYYLSKLPAILAPTWLLLPWERRRWLPVGARPEAVTAVVGLVVFSFFPAKQSHYLLPLLPVLFVLVGPVVDRTLQAGRRGGLLTLDAIALIGLGTAAVVLARREVLFEGAMRVGLLTAGLLVAAVALAVTLRAARHRRGRAVTVIEWAGATLAVVLTFLVFDGAVMSSLNPDRSGRLPMQEFARHIGDAPVGSLDDNPSVLYYLGRLDTTLVWTEEEAVRFLTDHSDGFLIVETDRGKPVPPSLARAPVDCVWTAPDGKDGWTLLGPGMTSTSRRG